MHVRRIETFEYFLHCFVQRLHFSMHWMCRLTLCMVLIMYILLEILQMQSMRRVEHFSSLLHLYTCLDIDLYNKEPVCHTSDIDLYNKEHVCHTSDIDLYNKEPVCNTSDIDLYNKEPVCNTSDIDLYNKEPVCSTSDIDLYNKELCYVWFKPSLICNMLMVVLGNVF